MLSLDLPAEMSPQEPWVRNDSETIALSATYELKKLQEASHVGDTDTALEELQRLISQREEWSNNGNKTKEVTTFDGQ